MAETPAAPDLTELHGLSFVEAIDRLYQSEIDRVLPTLAAKIAKAAQEQEERAHRLLAARLGNDAGTALPTGRDHKKETRAALLAWTRYSPHGITWRLSDWVLIQRGETLVCQVREQILTAAAERLVRALCEGKLIATGILEPAACSGYQHRPIKPEVFQVRRWLLHRDSGSRLVTLDAGGRDAATYSAVQVDIPDRAPTRADEKRCLDWLIRDLKERGVESISKKERCEHAIEHFGVSALGFNTRIWRPALELTGLTDKATRAGPKKKSPR